jgi:hypothetical protein
LVEFGRLTDNGRATYAASRDQGSDQMSDMQPGRPERPERPVIDGLIALVAVAGAVGLVLAGIVLVVTRMLGLGGGEEAAADSSARESMSIPPLEETTAAGDPAITLDTATAEPGEDDESSSDDASEAESSSSEPSESKSAKSKEISLSAGQLEVDNFGRIDLTGTYPGGEGAILQVQRFQGGQWVDFAATTSVTNETFSTYVMTGVSGTNTFRVLDKSTGKASNEVKVKVGG